MSRGEAPISQDPKLRIEELFVELLEADTALDGLEIVGGSNRDALVPPLHCFVLCRSVTPITRVGQNYFADVVVVVANNIDDGNHDARKAQFKLVLRALTKREPGYAAANGDARLLSWSIQEITEVSEGQNSGDLIQLRVAAWVSAPA